MAVIHDKDRLEGATSLKAWKDAAFEQLEMLVAQGDGTEYGDGVGGGSVAAADSADTVIIPPNAAVAMASSSLAQLQRASAELRMGVSPTLGRRAMAMAVRYSLYLLEKRAPGPGVEVRVAPYAAVKVLDGPASDPHNLTPPDVIELEPAVWLRMACGVTTWQEEKDEGHISAVGPRDDLRRFLPLV